MMLLIERIRPLLFLFLSTFFIGQLKAQDVAIEPPNWFVTAKTRTVQLLIRSPKVANAKVSSKLKGFKVVKQFRLESDNYLIALMEMAPGLKAGNANLEIKWADGKTKTVSYQLKADSEPRLPEQVNQSDAVYLITPDRFANGNPANDDAVGYEEKSDRQKNYARHGGDIEGIRKALPYFKDLGVTALWINPMLANNMPHSSYHGYAITDFYNIDARFGTNAEYINLVRESHKTGIKVIKDMVLNHAGSKAQLYLDPPAKSWFNHYGETNFRSNFRANVVADPHASKDDLEVMADGWFDGTMPDLNQRDTNLARYLTQNTLWWIWTSGIDGIRMDTYPYPDKNYLLDWTKAILKEFPHFYLVGEVWVGSPALASYWTNRNKAKNSDGYPGNLLAVTDFPLHGACNQAFNQGGGWEDGLNKIYNILSQDFVYDDPSKNIVFLDNHDVNRFSTEVGYDTSKMKLALTFLTTVRGIPQIYYGTEIMLHGKDGSHPELRQDFPGGWSGDSKNLFADQDRTPEQRAVFNHLQKLLKWRRNSEAIKNGKFIHYVGDGNTYVYARKTAKETVLVILNSSNKPLDLHTGHYKELLAGKTTGTDVLTKEVITDLSKLKVNPKSALVLELK